MAGCGGAGGFSAELLGESLAARNLWLHTHWGEGVPGVLGPPGGGRRDPPPNRVKTGIYSGGWGGREMGMAAS